MTKHNKVAPRNNVIGNNIEAKNTFLYRIIPVCNKIPLELTLLKSLILFKKWLNIYHSSEKLKEPALQRRPKNVKYFNGIDIPPRNIDDFQCP